MTEKLGNKELNNIWLDLILGNKEEHIEDIFISNKALEALTSITNWLKTQKHFKNTPDEEIKQIAVNILTGHILKIQRDISPNGHKAVFVNSFADHPDMQDVRHDIHDLITKKVFKSMQKVFIYAFITGSLIGVALYEIISYLTQ